MAHESWTQCTEVVDLSISEMLSALDTGEFTSVDLVCAYLNRIFYYDRTGISLNSVPIINPEALHEAKLSDERRQRSGKPRPLEGIPFTVKDSFMVKGLPIACGSPALADLIATDDAATVDQLRRAGAVLLGKTNMPPMAAGGVQPGVYGYSHSPYSPAYLTAAYGSGSSFGSGTATSASFAAFGMAEETLSSGRSPASNNALVAYTPSRGLISIRGNWPLRPTCDVVVPHTRSVDDLLRILDVVVVEDPDVRGDFWRQQVAVELPKVRDIRPASFLDITAQRLDGVRLGAPRLYLGTDPAIVEPPHIRESVKRLWDDAVAELLALGAEIVPIDLPVVSNYEENKAGAKGLLANNYITEEWQRSENGLLTAMALDEFLRNNGDSKLNTWADVDGTNVFPNAPDDTYTTKGRHAYDWQRLAEIVKAGLPTSYAEIPGSDASLKGLEKARKDEFENHLATLGLDGIIFPANGDVAPADVFERPESKTLAHQNGVVYSNGNRVLRHLGIPTVTVPMGTMFDTKMPVGLTFAGASYSDIQLLRFAKAYEDLSNKRRPPYRTPSIPSDRLEAHDSNPQTTCRSHFSSLRTATTVVTSPVGSRVTVTVEGIVDSQGDGLEQDQINQEFELYVWADGTILEQDSQKRTAFSGQLFASRTRLDPGIHVVVKARHRESGEVIGQHTLESLVSS